jgi:hypothetical protein
MENYCSIVFLGNGKCCSGTKIKLILSKFSEKTRS